MKKKKKKKKQKPPEIVELTADQVEALLRRAEAGLDGPDYQKVRAVIESYIYMCEVLDQKGTTIARLRKLLFGSGSEKTRDVTPPDDDGETQEGTDEAEPPDRQKEQAARPKGHGRNGADAYTGADRVSISHPSLRPGDSCPDCREGTVYEVTAPGVLVRITGQAPLQATVYELQKLRCGLCGKVFTAPTPEGVEPEKYDAKAGSMIALLKYGSGLPFNRLEGLQGNLGIPLPASTQWGVVQPIAGSTEPIYDELIRQAAQGEVLHNDDTTVKILEAMGKRAEKKRAEDQAAGEEPSERTGLFTSGIVSVDQGRKIALFFSGRQHAGENLVDVLGRRAAELGPPIQMCDALSRNMPAELKTIVANCLAHGRRGFVNAAGSFPAECRYVLETLREVYRNDALARERDLSPQQRLEFHQAESGPVMEELHTWLGRQFEERLVEPNSGLGQAISYLLKHWKKLTLFLRKPGAPLDNNITERVLKRAILHRKNSLFYKTFNGAHVGDIFMSLIHTCQLCGADAFDYLTQLQEHADSLSSDPSRWMPWNYRQTLNGQDASTNAPR
jgi:transposase